MKVLKIQEIFFQDYKTDENSSVCAYTCAYVYVYVENKIIPCSQKLPRKCLHRSETGCVYAGKPECMYVCILYVIVDDD